MSESGNYIPCLSRTYLNKPVLKYDIRFLSDHLAHLVGDKVTADNLYKISSAGFDYQIAKASGSELCDDDWFKELC